MVRTAGLLYLLIIVFGLLGEIFVRDRLVDYDNAAITAKNILANELWYRLGFVTELLMLLCDAGVAAILYVLLKEWHKGQATFLVFLRLLCIAILGVVSLSHYAVLYFIDGGEYLKVFSPEQLEAMALLSIKMHGAGYNVSLLFFGVHLLLLGYLMYRSQMLPWISGVLLIVAGICYEIHSFSAFLFPSFANSLFPFILIPCLLGELLFSLLLLVGRVRLPR